MWKIVKRKVSAPKPKRPEVGAKAATPKKAGPAVKRRAHERCELCGHWSSAIEYGVDEKSGYCDQWQKLTARDFWCEEFVSKDKFRALQEQLAEENEEYLDEET